MSEVRSYTHSSSTRPTVNATDVKEIVKLQNEMYSRNASFTMTVNTPHQSAAYSWEDQYKKELNSKRKRGLVTAVSIGATENCRKRKKCGVMNCIRIHPTLHDDRQGAEQTQPPQSTIILWHHQSQTKHVSFNWWRSRLDQPTWMCYGMVALHLP